MLILKTIKIFKNLKKVLLIHRGYVAAYMSVMRTKHMLPHNDDGLIIPFLKKN